VDRADEEVERDPIEQLGHRRFGARHEVDLEAELDRQTASLRVEHDLHVALQ
jgi:hypothetical protein